ncbi:MAG: hypothetical protein V1793_00670 [Pseudomonadota bacterium]
MGNSRWQEILREHKTLLVIIIIGFFLIEVEIFALAAMKSGRQTWMQVLDDSGKVIYEVKGSTMTNFNRYYFENTFGPFEKYKVKLDTKEVEFPFRAWFTAAVGIPVGLVLLLGFILKAVMVFLLGNPGAGESDMSQKSDPEPVPGTPVESLIRRISRFNIFILGFLVFAAVFLYWALPNILTFLARAGIETIIQFKWVFITGFSAAFILFAWFMHMKYQLAKKSMDVQVEIRKYELQLEYIRHGKEPPPALEYMEKRPLIERLKPGSDPSGGTDET